MSWQAKRSAAVAWSPLNNDRGLLACGTVANAIDDSFETTADLEVTKHLCLKMHDPLALPVTYALPATTHQPRERKEYLAAA
jgi:hypothetical protein